MSVTKGTIVYIGGMEMPDLNAAAHRVLNNAKAFLELGYNVVFCGVDKTIKQETKVPNYINGFESYPSKYPQNSTEWIKQLFSFRHIRFVLEKYNDLRIVIAYNMHAKPFSMLIKYCKKRNIKIISDITEWYENKFSFRPLKFIKWVDTKIVMERLQKKADGLIVISSFLEKYYKPFVNTIVRVPPLVDIFEKKWHPLCPTNEKITFTYSGLPGKEKDRIDLVVSALLYLPNYLDYQFNVFGLTKEQFVSDYPDLEKPLELLANKVSFFGRVSHEKSLENLFLSDYCVFIRDKTRKNKAGFPTKFVECITSGIGIITNNISDIGSFFPLRNSWIIDQTNQSTLTNVFMKAIANGKVRHTLSSTFDYHRYVALINSFFDRIYNV